MLACLKAASSGEIRRSPSPDGVSRLKVLVEIASEDDSAELHAQVAEEQQECDSHGPPLGALIVDVNIGDCEIGARLVGRPAELAGNHRVLDGPRRVPERTSYLDRRTREIARESVLVEENGAMVLGDHVEVLRQGTVGDQARPLLYVNHIPRAIEVRSQQAWIRTSCGSRVPREVLEFVCRTSAALVRLKSGARRPAGRLIKKLGSRRTVSVKVRNGSGAPA